MAIDVTLQMQSTRQTRQYKGKYASSKLYWQLRRITLKKFQIYYFWFVRPFKYCSWFVFFFYFLLLIFFLFFPHMQHMTVSSIIFWGHSSAADKKWPPWCNSRNLVTTLCEGHHDIFNMHKQMISEGIPSLTYIFERQHIHTDASPCLQYTRLTGRIQLDSSESSVYNPRLYSQLNWL